MTDQPFDRIVVKQRMVDLRRALRGACWCDICGNELGWEMHEIINRKATQNFEWLRELSFQPEICSILCAGCHEHRATMPDGVNALLRCNIRLYGFEDVKHAIYRIPEAFWPIVVANAWREIIVA